jgi:hypothetical protein
MADVAWVDVDDKGERTGKALVLVGTIAIDVSLHMEVVAFNIEASRAVPV